MCCLDPLSGMEDLLPQLLRLPLADNLQSSALWESASATVFTITFLSPSNVSSGQSTLGCRNKAPSLQLKATLREHPSPSYLRELAETSVEVASNGRGAWRRKWQPTSVFLPGESHGRRSLVCYSPRGCKESDFVSDFKKKKKGRGEMN